MPFEIICGRIRELRSNHLLSWLCLVILISGCIGTKNLKDGELLLDRQHIKGNKIVESGRLAELYQQQPNKKVLKVLPISLYTWMYQTGVRKFDTAKINLKKVKIEQKFDQKIAKHAGDNSKIIKLTSRKAARIAKKDDVLKNGNSFMQKGEPLAVYDSALMIASRDKMQLFLHNKGFFHGTVKNRS